MLVLSRKPGQQIVVSFGDQTATLEVLTIEGSRVQLGIVAPAAVGIHREEVWAEITTAECPGSLVEQRAIKASA